MTDYNKPIEVIRLRLENSDLILSLPLHSRFLDVREVAMNGKRGRPVVLMKGCFPIHTGHYAELFKNALAERRTQREREELRNAIPTPQEPSHARISKRL